MSACPDCFGTGRERDNDPAEGAQKKCPTCCGRGVRSSRPTEWKATHQITTEDSIIEMMVVEGGGFGCLRTKDGWTWDDFWSGAPEPSWTWLEPYYRNMRGQWSNWEGQGMDPAWDVLELQP